MKNVHKILVEKPKGKRPLGRPGHRCEETIKRILKELFGRVKTAFV
jgi:hypothetical protein